MTVWVYRDGELVEKATAEPLQFAKSANFPTPRVSRMDPFESPVTGREITSWRQRDRDMRAADAYDPRDLSKDHHFRRGRAVQMKEADDGRE